MKRGARRLFEVALLVLAGALLVPSQASASTPVNTFYDNCGAADGISTCVRRVKEIDNLGSDTAVDRIVNTQLWTFSDADVKTYVLKLVEENLRIVLPSAVYGTPRPEIIDSIPEQDLIYAKNRWGWYSGEEGYFSWNDQAEPYAPAPRAYVDWRDWALEDYDQAYPGLTHLGLYCYPWGAGSGTIWNDHNCDQITGDAKQVACGSVCGDGSSDETPVMVLQAMDWCEVGGTPTGATCGEPSAAQMDLLADSAHCKGVHYLWWFVYNSVVPTSVNALTNPTGFYTKLDQVISGPHPDAARCDHVIG